MGGVESGRARNGSTLSKSLSREVLSSAESNSDELHPGAEEHPKGSLQLEADGRLSRPSLSSLKIQKTPARSYFQRSYHDSHSNVSMEPAYNSSQSVREDTAELASRALGRGHSPSPQRSIPAAGYVSDSHLADQDEDDSLNQRGSSDQKRPNPILEIPEPPSQSTSRSSSRSQHMSALSEMIRNSPTMRNSPPSSEEEEMLDEAGQHVVTVNGGILSQPTERTRLLLKKAAQRSELSPVYGSVQDLENCRAVQQRSIVGGATTFRQFRAGPCQSLWAYANPKHWSRQQIWLKGLRQPLSFIPSVLLGLLLNILDALSYGMILFPLSEAIFADLGPDGISMFYVSCIVSQLVYSCGGSIFKGGIGSEMIEVVPFFHKMAFTILNHVGEGNPKAVLATTIVSYSVSSILTGLVFFLMGQFKVGALIGFFPRHILLGCIGGVGLFLLATGLEVSGRLEGSFEYNLATLQYLFQPEKLPLWMTPLALAIILLFAKRWIKHPLTDATYFISIIFVFYVFEWALPNLSLPELRSRGWVFEAPKAGVPFYHFYTLYDFNAVDWKALGSTVPAMLALTFFGILHVPINIPALGLTTGEDNVDVDRELRAHGISNALSGLFGSIQNYLVYTNTVLFMRSGGDSRVAGVMLAIATCGILVSGTSIIGFIPVMVVGALIFFLGIDLMREALVDTWGRVHRLEYATIIIIVVAMGVWDFVIGILIGVLLACVSYVLQSSQISAIRGKLYGGVANSTVRRHPIQWRFLQDAGSQIHVMKLAGYLFFGTIVGVEKQIRQLLDESFRQQPIRFLILDLYNVDGVDFSAAEAFTRVNRILKAKNVKLTVCGISLDGETGRSLRNVGLFDEEDDVQYFPSLNSALEFCENELLKAFYRQNEVDRETKSNPAFLEVPKSKQGRTSQSENTMYNSPRQNHLHHVATMTLSEQDPAPPSRWESYEQPLQLLLHTFSTVSDKPEDFWKPAAAYFVRREFAAGSNLYSVGEAADGFYVLESGMLKAKYDLPQGKYSELIVAGTTCGELPFFSSTVRTSTTQAERDCITWMLSQEKWMGMQEKHPAISQEMLKVSLKLTSERMDAITKYMLLTSG